MKNQNIFLTGTIVLYKSDINILKKTINSFLATPLLKTLFLIDNSPTDKLKKEFIHPEIEYFFIDKNIGFGAAHNKVIDKIKEKSTYHLILNPDVSFNSKVIPNLIKVVETDHITSLISPRVLYPNGKHQYTCRKFPTFFELIIRRSGFVKQIFSPIVAKREYRNLDLSNPFYPDFIIGCFLLFKSKDFIKINGFDERYFMYMEDVDICRKIAAINKKVLYFPKEEIIHIYKKESSKNINLFIDHISSIFQYFYKWNITNSK
jgi:GT2 family glycosyltransferase